MIQLNISHDLSEISLIFGILHTVEMSWISRPPQHNNRQLLYTVQLLPPLAQWSSGDSLESPPPYTPQECPPPHPPPTSPEYLSAAPPPVHQQN